MLYYVFPWYEDKLRVIEKAKYLMMGRAIEAIEWYHLRVYARNGCL
jgi:hypothetical protein